MQGREHTALVKAPPEEHGRGTASGARGDRWRGSRRRRRPQGLRRVGP